MTVFGGTGFLGRRITERLGAHGFAVRIAARHPEQAAAATERVQADIHDEGAVGRAVAGAWGVVNAVSLYVEKDGRTFQAVHMEAAGRLAKTARRAGVTRLIQVSGLGADPQSPSGYVRSRGQGELAVRADFPDAIIIRPSAMFAADGGLVTSLAALLRRAPVFPMFGRGQTRLQPAFADDVAEAVARIMALPQPASLYEFGGPEVLTYKALLRDIQRRLGARGVLMPLPFAVWTVAAHTAEWLPNPPVSSGQVALMRHDNVASGNAPGFAELGIQPRGIAAAFGDSGRQQHTG